MITIIVEGYVLFCQSRNQYLGYEFAPMYDGYYFATNVIDATIWEDKDTIPDDLQNLIDDNPNDFVKIKGKHTTIIELEKSIQIIPASNEYMF